VRLLAGIPGTGFIEHLVESVVAHQVAGILSGWVGAVNLAVGWLVKRVNSLITYGVRPGLGHNWFRQRYGIMVTIGALAFVAVLSVAAIQAVVRQDPGLLLRTVLVQLPLAVVLTMTALGLVQVAMTVVDHLTTFVLSGRETTAGGHQVFSWAPAVHRPDLPDFLNLVMGVLALAGGLLLWIELVVRAAAIDLATLFLPLALVGMAWPGASHWARRLAEVLAALILSKFVIAATLALGSAAISGGTGSGTVLIGAVLMVMAALTPFAVLRLVPLVEVGAIAHLEGMGRRAVTKGPHLAWSIHSRLNQLDLGPEAKPPVPERGTAPIVRERANWTEPLDGQGHPSGAFGAEPPLTRRREPVAPGPGAPAPAGGAGDAGDPA
jgi:hypothetical protein